MGLGIKGFAQSRSLQMKGEWKIIKYTTKHDPPEYVYYMEPTSPGTRHKLDNVLCTGTWDECAALGKLVGCQLWWDEVELKYRVFTD
jgi:hypothetical protein